MDPLLHALETREALLREIGGRGTASDPGAVLTRIVQEVSSGGKGPTADPSIQNRITEIEELLAKSRAEVEKLQAACREKDSRIETLTRRVRELETAQSGNTESDAKVKELERSLRETIDASKREREKQEEAIGRMTHRIAELRVGYESRIAELTAKIESQGPDADPPSPPAQEAGSPLPKEPFPSFEPTGPPGLFLVDDSVIGMAAEQKLTQSGFLLTRSPATIRSEKRRTACIAVNLALPGTWTALRTLRHSIGAPGAQIVAYILAPRAETGYWLGRTDVLTLPVVRSDLAEALRKLAKSLKHAILIGMDNKLAARIANNLAAMRITATAAVDRRDALNAIRETYPQAAILYPGHNAVDAFRALAGIKSLHIFEDLPSAILLDPTPGDREAEYLSAGARTLLRLGTFKTDELGDRIAAAANASGIAASAPH